MTKVLGIVVVAMAMTMGAAAYAGSCCGSKTEKSGCDMKMSKRIEAISSLNLTDEQKAKIASLQESCKAGGSTPEACATACSEMMKVLTEEQRAQVDSAMGSSCGMKKAATKKSGGCCPAMKSGS